MNEIEAPIYRSWRDLKTRRSKLGRVIARAKAAFYRWWSARNAEAERRERMIAGMQAGGLFK